MKIISQEMRVVSAVSSSRLYADVKSDVISYDGESFAEFFPNSKIRNSVWN